VMISSVETLDETDQPISGLRHDQTLVVRAIYHTPRPLDDPIVKVRLVRADGTVCAMSASRYQADLSWMFEGTGVIQARFEPIQMVAGKYAVEVRIIDTTDSILLASGQSPWITVDSPGFIHETDRGIFVPNLSWSHQPGDGNQEALQTKQSQVLR
jgi:hypothetical protein